MIELITSAAILISSVYSTPAQATTTVTITPLASSTASSVATSTSFTDNTGVMAYVKTQYANEPVLVDIARCESTFRQYDPKTGAVLRGKVNNQDVGVMQINEKYQGEKAISLGYDIDTVEGNVAYAQYLYDNQGAVPWDSSSPCWSKALSASNNNNKLAVN